jgi:hypothetical protein
MGFEIFRAIVTVPCKDNYTESKKIVTLKIRSFFYQLIDPDLYSYLPCSPQKLWLLSSLTGSIVNDAGLSPV